MRFIDQLLSAVDMTASERTVVINGKPFSFFVTPLTAAERERALKSIGSNEITPANAGRYTMSLILSKVRVMLTISACLLMVMARVCVMSCLVR